MNPIPIPAAAHAGRPWCSAVAMGPPPGVSGDDCGTVEMLIDYTEREKIPGFPARAQYAYYRPTETELEHLRNGGFIELCQYGSVVQPFSAVVWPSPPPAHGRPVVDAPQA